MRRYLLFAGWNYYPQGGYKDLQGSFDSLEDARKHRDEYYKAEGCKLDDDNSFVWYHIVDTNIGMVLEQSE